MTIHYTPDQLAADIRRSRALLPQATAALRELICGISGKSPDPRRVEYVSLFWALQACDRVVASEGTHDPQPLIRPDQAISSATRRSRLLSGFSAKDKKIVVVDPYLKLSFARELSAVVKSRQVIEWGTHARIPSTVKSPAIECRQRLINETEGRSDDISRLRRLVALTAPCELVESHDELTNWAERDAKRNLGVLYSANAHQASIPFRYRMFAQRERGTKIAIHQHGGGYGIDETHIGEEHDIAISDKFYSWGWIRPDLGDRVRPLATAAPAKRNENPDRGYLLMSLPVTSTLYRFQPFLVPYHVTLMVRETISFVRNLESSVDLRIRSSGAAVFPMHQLSRVGATLSVDTGRNSGPMEASRSKLVIHNYLGTSWLETLAMNVPTVCFYDPSIFRAREAARPFIDALARVGVIHHSGAEAARFVNDLNGDPSVWWSKPEVQEARESFVARYANFKEDWLPGWIEEFERLLAE
jgi:putative transferase (TIGR04331 family)